MAPHFVTDKLILGLDANQFAQSKFTKVKLAQIEVHSLTLENRTVYAVMYLVFRWFVFGATFHTYIYVWAILNQFGRS